MVCVICLVETEFVYEPQKSKVGLRVHVCPACGFVQTSKNSSKVEVPLSKKISSLSCDADYSPIRVGKQQMTDVDIRNIESCSLEGIPAFNFLDMASARGHFVQWAKLKSQNTVWCIESDEYMTVSYQKDPNIELFIGDFNDLDITSSFDFIYSCHTLEHFRDPVKYLEFVFNHLNTNGYFYLNVPNLLGILDSIAIDDFFYDNHRVYFDPETLISLLERQGLIVLAEWEDAACIRLLLQKSEKRATPEITSNYARNKELIVDYSANLAKSRKILPGAVLAISNLLNKDSTKIILGCGRMLDALIVYGGLDLSKFDFLVDNYLGLATSKLYERNLYRLETLPAIVGDMQFVVFSRTSNQEIGKLISAIYPAAQINYVGSILELFKP